jgi:hypothetical protein
MKKLCIIAASILLSSCYWIDIYHYQRTEAERECFRKSRDEHVNYENCVKQAEKAIEEQKQDPAQRDASTDYIEKPSSNVSERTP